MSRTRRRRGFASILVLVAAAACTACSSGAPSIERTGSASPGDGADAEAGAEAESEPAAALPTPPDIEWTPVYRETFDDPAAAQDWLWERYFPPTIADGAMTWTTQSGQAGYTGIGADDSHVGFGGGADDESLRTIRVTANVSLQGVAAYGATCLDADSSGGYSSPSMYALIVTSSGARISKTLDGNPSETLAASKDGVLPDPFVGAITVTCAPVDGGYYLEVALDDHVLVATIDRGSIPEGRNARLYDQAASVDSPTISIDEVTIEVPAS